MFIRRLREERTARGLRQTDLADLVSGRFGTKLHGTGITRIEKGTQGVGLNEAVALAAALELDLSELLTASPAMDAGAALAAAEEQLADLEAQEQVIAAERQVAGARVERLRAIVRRQEE